MATNKYGVTESDVSYDGLLLGGTVGVQVRAETIKASAGVLKEGTVLERHGDTGNWEQLDQGTAKGVLYEDLSDSGSTQTAKVIRFGVVNAKALILPEGGDGIRDISNDLADNGIFVHQVAAVEADES